MWNPFKKKAPPANSASGGSMMQEQGVLQCKCGTKIPVRVAAVLPTVPTSRFADVDKFAVVLTGVPCPDCNLSYTAQLSPGKKNKRLK